MLTRVAWCRFTALYASSAACAALFARDRVGGRGQIVTVDMLHVCMHHTSLDLHNNKLWEGHEALQPFPEFSALYSRFLFTCKDLDQIVAVPFSDAEAQAFATAYEEELGEDLCRQIMPRKKGEQSGGELGTLAQRIARIDDFVKICERRGETDRGVQGAHLNPLGLFLNPLGHFLRTSIPFIWCIMSAFLPA